VLAREPKSSQEILAGALAALFRAAFGVVKLLRHWNALEGIDGMFFSEQGLFEERAGLIARAAHFEHLNYTDYAKEFEFEDGLEMLIVKDAERQFAAAKTELMTYVKETGKKDDPLFRDAMKCALHGAMLVKQLDRKKKYQLDPNGKVVFPVFIVCGK
jgi:hypothetical protein